ncbi:hypothetical protein BDR04DRAFT_1059700, partial [Suillus decipiens]
MCNGLMFRDQVILVHWEKVHSILEEIWIEDDEHLNDMLQEATSWRSFRHSSDERFREEAQNNEVECILCSYSMLTRSFTGGCSIPYAESVIGFAFDSDRESA